jgi:FixJ family two-component response regulator
LHHTDCVISGVQMPGMNGLELQNKLIVRRPRLPIIFVTAFSEMRARAQALRAGAIGFLAKPFSDEELISCANAALGCKARLDSPATIRLRSFLLRHRHCTQEDWHWGFTEAPSQSIACRGSRR